MGLVMEVDMSFYSYEERLSAYRLGVSPAEYRAGQSITTDEFYRRTK